MKKATLGKGALHLAGLGLIVIGVAMWSSKVGPLLFIVGLIVEGLGLVLFDKALRKNQPKD